MTVITRAWYNGGSDDVRMGASGRTSDLIWIAAESVGLFFDEKLRPSR